MVGGDAPGATYWLCPICLSDLIVGYEANHLETPLPHKRWTPGDHIDYPVAGFWSERASVFVVPSEQVIEL